MKTYRLTDGSFRVCLVDFKCGAIKAAVAEDADGYATIYINEKLAPDAKKRAFLHELRHLRRDDLHNDRPIWEVES